MYRNGRIVENTKNLSYAFSGLTCNTSYTLGVRTFLGGGDASTRAELSARTATCDGTPPPGPTPTAPANTSLPTITGPSQSGSVLSSSAGAWSGTTPLSLASSWSRCNTSGAACSPIAGATGTSYLLGSADVGFTIRVSVTASNSVGSATATSVATPVVTSVPTPPPPGGNSVILVDQQFVCNGPVNLAFVKVTMRFADRDAISLGPNCSGRIGRIEVDTWTQDGVKVQNNSSTPAHDLVIDGGYVECHAITPGAHQDGLQAMGGARLTFRNLVIDCLGHSNFFVARGGAGATTPTDVVCENCVLGPHGANAARIATSSRSGLRNTIGCRSFRYNDGLIFMTDALSAVNTGNLDLASNDSRCNV
jgi:hypothetical protein